jgi:hypothetical protein
VTSGPGKFGRPRGEEQEETMNGWTFSDDRLRAMYAGGRADPTARRFARLWAGVFRLGLLPRRWITLEKVPGARPHIPVNRHAPVADFEAISPRYPVFWVVPDPVTPTARKRHWWRWMAGAAVAVTISARRDGSEIQAAGSIPVPFADWRIIGPAGYGLLGSLADHGTAEFRLVLDRDLGPGRS